MKPLALLLLLAACGGDEADSASHDLAPAPIPAQVAEPTPALSADRSTVLGLNSHLLEPADVEHLKTLGITHVRHTLYWPLWEDPGYRAAFAQQVAQAHEQGLELLIVVHNWAGGPVLPGGTSRDSMQAFAEFVADRAAQFPQVEAWQLWNEPDVWVQPPFGASEGLPMRERGRLYAEQLRIAYPQIKAANPDALVVSAGTAAPPDTGFLAGLLESEPPVDAVAIHAYGPWPALRERIREAHRIVDGAAPVWVTEAGAKREDDAEHLAVWSSVIEGNAREELAARLYPYVLQTDPRYPGHGLLGADGRPRPTYDWLREYCRDPGEETC